MEPCDHKFFLPYLDALKKGEKVKLRVSVIGIERGWDKLYAKVGLKFNYENSPIDGYPEAYFYILDKRIICKECYEFLTGHFEQPKLIAPELIEPEKRRTFYNIYLAVKNFLFGHPSNVVHIV